MFTLESPCPCCSGKKYSECCQTFHDGMFPDSASQLMSSRYSAYALNKADYLILTTHPKNLKYQSNKIAWKKSIEEFSKSTIFQKLEIHDFSDQTGFSTVTFTAHLLQGDTDATFTEKSFFEKIGPQWLYLRGEFSNLS